MLYLFDKVKKTVQQSPVEIDSPEAERIKPWAKNQRCRTRRSTVHVTT
jgi:hypothetical protein